jgi:hypothetical protein
MTQKRCDWIPLNALRSRLRAATGRGGSFEPAAQTIEVNRGYSKRWEARLWHPHQEPQRGMEPCCGSSCPLLNPAISVAAASAASATLGVLQRLQIPNFDALLFLRFHFRLFLSNFVPLTATVLLSVSVPKMSKSVD